MINSALNEIINNSRKTILELQEDYLLGDDLPNSKEAPNIDVKLVELIHNILVVTECLFAKIRVLEGF